MLNKILKLLIGETLEAGISEIGRAKLIKMLRFVIVAILATILIFAPVTEEKTQLLKIFTQLLLQQ